MATRYSTQSVIKHSTTLLQANRASLDETLDTLRSERRTGTLTVGFGQGGINSVTFEELTRTTQAELDAWDEHRHGGNGHLATRGEVRILPCESDS